MNKKKSVGAKIEINTIRLLNIVPELIDVKKTGTLVELGARDCINTELFRKKLKKFNIISFECNPSTLGECRKRIRGLDRVTLVEKAVTNKNGNIVFYPVDQNKSDKTIWSDGNPGASSMYKISDNYPNEKLVQKKIIVPCTRLDTYVKKNNIQIIDLLFMDIQGGELLALKGLNKSIDMVKVIHTEANFFPFYDKQPLYNDLKKYLNKKGFHIYGVSCFTGPFADFIFVNNKFYNYRLLKLRELLLDFIYAKVAYTTYSIMKKSRYYKEIMSISRKILNIFHNNPQ